MAAFLDQQLSLLALTAVVILTCLSGVKVDSCEINAEEESKNNDLLLKIEQLVERKFSQLEAKFNEQLEGNSCAFLYAEP